MASLRGGADEAVHAATKFAQVGLAGALDREVRPEGIRVATVCPAGVHTEFAIGAGRTEGDPALADYLQPEDVAHTITNVLRQPSRRDRAVAAVEHGPEQLSVRSVAEWHTTDTGHTHDAAF